MTEKSIFSEITHEGQPFFDRPVYVAPTQPAALESEIAAIFKRPMPKPIMVRRERVRLDWVSPAV